MTCEKDRWTARQTDGQCRNIIHPILRWAYKHNTHFTRRNMLSHRLFSRGWLLKTPRCLGPKLCMCSCCYPKYLYQQLVANFSDVISPSLKDRDFRPVSDMHWYFHGLQVYLKHQNSVRYIRQSGAEDKHSTSQLDCLIPTWGLFFLDCTNNSEIRQP